MTFAKRRKRGFERTSGLVSTQVRKASEARGFAESRLLTNWVEIVGEATASMARPVKVTYGRQKGFGAVLTLLTTGSFAPMVQAEVPKIKERVNACYGYNAISDIRVTQTAPTGFSEGRVQFGHAPKTAIKRPDPAVFSQATDLTTGVESDALRAALEQLARNVLTKHKQT
ncbi:DUF721 domain-containing protein [Aquimixticola soesokkakensis]|uniref:DUF721 domain-containing protein n=1 Tax=Aquimixticola soesokkakensis TaxID=1519096 RepID=UPI00351FCC81